MNQPPAGADPAQTPAQRKGSLRGPIALLVLALLVIAALVVAAVLLAPRFDPRGGGEPIPAGIEPEQGTPSLPDPAEEGVEAATEEELVATVLRYEMETAVLGQAAVDLPITSECTPSSETVYECTVTLDDQPVRSTIEVEDIDTMRLSSGGVVVSDRTRFSYTVLEQETVVTAHAVHLQVQQLVENSQERYTQVSDPRCDEDLPDIQVVADGERASGTCYVTPNGWRGWPNWSQTVLIDGHSVGPSVWKD